MHILSLLSCTTERINKKIASRTKNCILALCWSFIMANSVLRLFLPSDLQYMVVVLCGTALLGVMLLLIFDRNACEGCLFRRIPLILTEVIGISFLFNGIYYRVLAYIAVGIIFSLLLPLLHRGIAAYGVSAFFAVASRGILISYCVLLVASLLCGPALSMSHYTAIFENANSLGDYLIVATMALLYLLNNTDRSRKKCVLYYAMLSSILIFCIFSYSRTALLAILTEIVGYVAVKIILHIRNKKRTHIGAVVKKAGVILLTFLVTACVVYGLFVPVKKQIEQWLPSIQIRAGMDGFYGGSFKDNIIGAGSYFAKGLDGNKDGNAGEDVFTSGRKGIWMSFAKEIKILGHASESREDIEVDRYYKSTNAHNVYLQLGYSAGILAGIAMILLLVWVAVMLIKGLIETVQSGNLSDGFLIAALSTVGFIFPSITSAGYMLFTYLPATMFWLSLSALDVKKCRQ